MTVIFLSIAIALVLFLIGDWLHRVLAGGPSRNWPAHFVLSSWAGLMVGLVVMTTLYHGTGAVRVRDLAWPVVVLFTAMSACSAFFTGSQKTSRDSFPWELILVATGGFLLISSPFFGLGGSGFYFSNNGEYINYAAVADVVKYHRASIAAGVVQIESRESVAGILCAFFSTLFGKSSIFIVQPFSNAVAWLSFATLGVLLHRVVGRWPAATWQRLSVLVIYGVAILSAANLQLWTMSFLSQYLNTAIFFGLLTFLAEYSDKTDQWQSRQILGIGIAAGAMLCVYPEMFPASVLLLSAFYLLSVRQFSTDLITRFGALAVAMIVAAIVGNKLGFELLVQFRGGSAALTGRAGWNIFGTTEVRTLVGNLFGLSNLFYSPQPPGLLLTSSVLVIVVATIVHAVVTFNSRATPLARGASGLTLCYIAASALLLVLVTVQSRETNYVAVKFIVAFMWIFFLAAASWVTSLRVNSLGVGVVLLWVVLLFRVLSGGGIFAQRLEQAARMTRFSERDMEAVRSALGSAPDVFVSGEPWNMKVIGLFLAHGEDLLRLLEPKPRERITELQVVSSVSEFANQEHVLTMGNGRRPIRGYHLAVQRDTLAIWARSPSSGNAIRTIAASSSYGGLGMYMPENAVDGDEGTAWVSQGSGPATVIITPSHAGIVESLTLLARHTGMFECWQRLDVSLYRMGQQVAHQEFSFPDAATTAVQEVALRPIESDKIELSFSNAVTRTPSGKPVDPASVNPGYSEIVVTWSK